MKNMDQIRAMNALAACDQIRRDDSGGRGDQGGDALTGFPALVINNGLLSALAFSQSKSKSGKSGHEIICDQIAIHLASSGIECVDSNVMDTDSLINSLVNGDSMRLRICTAEALAFLNYLRRFAKAGNGGKGVEE